MQINWYFDTSLISSPTDFSQSVNTAIRGMSIVPTRLSSELIASRKGMGFTLCPAYNDFIRNMFVVKSPLDLEFEVDYPKAVKLVTPDISQEVINLLFDVRFNSGNDMFPHIEIGYNNYFVSDKPVNIEVLPAFMHYNGFTNNATLIPGIFDISKWVRPVTFSFELKSKQSRVSIKRGDVLFYVRFQTDETVKLNEIQFGSNEYVKLDKTASLCSGLRHLKHNQPLIKRYETLKNALSRLKFK